MRNVSALEVRNHLGGILDELDKQTEGRRKALFDRVLAVHVSHHRFLLAGVFLAAAASGLWAADIVPIPGFPSDARVGLAATDRVRLRAAPSTSAAVVRTLNLGDLAIIEGQSEQPQKIGQDDYYWQHLKLADGTEGWAFGAFIYTAVACTLPASGGRGGYPVAEFVHPLPADLRDFGGSIALPAVVDATGHRGLLIKVRGVSGVSSTADGWLDFGGDESEDIGVEAVSGVDRTTILVVFHHRIITQQNPDSRTALTCTQVTGGKYPFFVVTKVESLPVN